jgi:hypothetical protein
LKILKFFIFEAAFPYSQKYPYIPLLSAMADCGLGTRPAPADTGAVVGGAVPGRARQRRLAVRPAAVRPQAGRSAALGRAEPGNTDLIDNRSGVCHQEYRCVYGEEVEAASRFPFNA